MRLLIDERLVPSARRRMAPSPIADLMRRCEGLGHEVDVSGRNGTGSSLDELASGDLDVVVTEDDAIHRAGRSRGLGEQVLTVADALAWIARLYDPDPLLLPSVLSRTADQVRFDDPIFAELATDYPDFARWTQKCRAERRDCWVVMDVDRLAGIVVRKDETQRQAGTRHPGPQILKLCTFKVSVAHRGRKLGEQLLKQVCWFAQRSGYDLVYLTVFPKQDALIRLIEEYGFERTLSLANGEHVYEKPIRRGRLPSSSGEAALAAARTNYPRFTDGPGTRKFLIPIQPDYHAKLFPEATASGEAVEQAGAKPGNTIRKVYICRAPTNRPRPGDLMFFYLSRTGVPRYSRIPGLQSVTSVGVIESVRSTADVGELRRWTAKRSVFSDEELREKVQGATPHKVIDFLLIGHLGPPIPLDALLHEGVTTSWPQSVTELRPDAYGRLRPLVDLGFEF